MNDSCKFFQWADENIDTSNATFGESSRKTSRGKKNENPQKRPRAGTSKRKCGVCGQEGLYFTVYCVLP